MKVSALILTLNEEGSLPDCLRSIDWCDDVCVLDSFSTDATVEIARKAGARLLQRQFDTFADQRNYGLDHGEFRHDWVLHLDADEMVSPALREEIDALFPEESIDAFRLPSKMMFRGRWLKHSGMYPTYQVRLGHRTHLRFEQVGHGQREALPSERLGTLRCALVHNSFAKGLDEWIQRHHRYASQEADEALARPSSGGRDGLGLLHRDPMQRRRALKRLSYRFPCRPLLRFVYMYILRMGFLDGVPGLHYCRLLAMYERMISSELHKRRRKT